MKKNKQQMRTKSPRNRLIPYLFILPFLISFIVFFVYPSVYSFVLSFFSYKGYGEAEFIGLSNYNALIHYNMFWNSLKNTFYYFLVRFVPMMVVSFMAAYVLTYSVGRRASRFYKPVLFIPQMVTIVAASLCWKVILGKEYGVINQVFGTSIDFLGDPQIMKLSVVAMMMWRAMGWFMVIYMSGLTTISSEVIEASKIDGANSRQRLFYIVLPLMKPIFLFTFLMDAINAMKVFTEPSVLLGTTGSSYIPTAAEPILGLLVTRLNGGSFGLAAAVGWMLFFVIMLMVGVINFIFKDRKEKGV